MDEIWKEIYYQDIFTGEIIDYRGLYKVSNYGRVKSLKGRKGEKRELILKNQQNQKGYQQIRLVKNGHGKTLKVHRLVGFMFIPNNDISKNQINHIDENKENNHVSNLEWITNKDNSNHGTCQKRREENHRKKCNYHHNTERGKPVILIKENEHFIFSTISECKKYGFSAQSIIYCCEHKFKQVKGFKAYYLDEYMDYYMKGMVIDENV